MWKICGFRSPVLALDPAAGPARSSLMRENGSLSLRKDRMQITVTWTISDREAAIIHEELRRRRVAQLPSSLSADLQATAWYAIEAHMLAVLSAALARRARDHA